MMTVNQYAKHTRLGADTIRRYCRLGLIPHIKVDRYYIDWQEADKCIRAMAMEALKANDRPTNYREAVAQMKQDALSV